MEYRRATVEDIDELVEMRMAMRAEREDSDCKISLEDFRARTAEYFRARIPDGSFIVWVAIDIGAIVATGGVCMHHVPPTYSNPSGRVGYIVNMYTVLAHRGNGIASKLLECLVEEARQNGCDRVALNTSRAGQRVYERYGFTDVPGEMEYFLHPAECPEKSS
jgi:GNAT superfamily N-acetyltransferase